MLAKRNAFPEIVFESTGAPELLVDKVRHILRELVDSPNLEKSLRKDLERVRSGDYQRKPGERQLASRLGELVYNQLGEDFQAIHRMAYDIDFDTGSRNPKKLTVVFRCLEKVTNKIFCSPKRFLVDFQSQQLVVAFDRHAIEQIGTRTVVNPSSYADRGKSFAFAYSYQYFDFTQLANGDPAIRIWDFCNPEQFMGDVHAELLGPDVSAAKVGGFPFLAKSGKLCYYLVGYCPLKQYLDLPEYLVLKTLLVPGMDRTPEFSAYKRSRRPSTVDLMEFGKRAGRATYAGLRESRDMDWIRLLHEFEPQVKPIEDDVFDYPENSVIKLGTRDFLTLQKHLAP